MPEITPPILKIQPRVIFIEAGHRDTWFGTSGAKGNGIDERVYCRDLAIAIEAILNEKPELVGFRYQDSSIPTTKIQTVGVETSLTIEEKTTFIKTYILENKIEPKECYSISLHLNSYSSHEPTGTEIYYKHGSDTAGELAESVIDSFKRYNLFPLRSQHLRSSKGTRADYIDDFWTNSILIEAAFLSNLFDAKTLKENRARLAQCIAHGLLNFFR